MKNVIALLLASSAAAQRTADAARELMDDDEDFPKPKLIADTWNDGDCTDASGNVATTKAALATALTAASTANSDQETLRTTFFDALDARAAAVTAIITQNGTMATLLAADDAAQQSVLTLKGLLDAATYAEAAAIAAAAAAVTAKTAADADLLTATTLQTALNTAASSAASHYSAEQGSTATLLIAKNAADASHATETSNLPAIALLRTTAKGLMDTKAASVATALVTKNDATALAAALLTMKTAAATAIDNTAVGSVAKIHKDADDTLTPLTGTFNTAKTAWVAHGTATVTAMKTWLVSPETWSAAIGTAAKCNAGTAVNHAAGDGGANDNTCRTHCETLLAWTMNAGATLPEGAITTGALYCFGIDHSTGGLCELYNTTKVTTAAADNSSAGYVCKARTKTASGEALAAAIVLSKAAGTTYVALNTALDNWATQNLIVQEKNEALQVATQYKTKIDTAHTSAATADTNATNAYNTVNGELTPLTTDYNTKDGNNTTQVALIATKLAEKTAAQTAYDNQSAEETRQLAIKNLADADKAAQDIIVTGLTTAQTTAAGLVTSTATASTAATTAKGTANTNHAAGVTAATAAVAALATDAATLATLTTTADTAWTAVGTAQTALNSAAADTAAANIVVTTATAANLAAVVACKNTNFDSYWTTYLAAQATRTSNLAAIKSLLMSQVKPARGTAGARCEKAMSNGTFRPARVVGEAGNICGAGLCCGAARVPKGSAVMIIETCQPAGATTYTYVPPRAPMATTMPAGSSVPFTCIDGAQKLAAAASALAAAVYMLA